MVRLFVGIVGIAGLVCVEACLGGPVPVDAKADAIRAEHRRFEGTWVVESMIMEGEPAPESQYKTTKLVLKGDRFLNEEGFLILAGIYTIDPTAKPKTIDVTIDLPGGKKMTRVGIYTLDGDTYTLCIASPGRARPTVIASKRGSGEIVQVLKRIKP